MIALLTLLIGLLTGFYARTMYDHVVEIKTRLKDSQEYKKAGVVRPNVTPVNNDPIDLSSSTGPVRRLTPEQHALRNMQERDDRLKNA